MGLISKTVKVKWNGNTKKHYVSLGYEFTKMGDEFEVKVGDLFKGSNIRVDCVCDNCGKELNWYYTDYNKQVKEDGKTYCHNCAIKLYGGENSRKTRVEKGKSFAQWCIKNNRKDVLDRWDYELNNCSPNDINISTHKKYWFKCDKHIKHKSELKDIHSFTSGHEGSICCNQCNSFAQWCVDNNRQDVLNRWDYELNSFTPWEISYANNKKCWFKCDKHTEHKSELKNIASFASGQEGSISCKQCNSFAQWCIDHNRQDVLDRWDYELNEYSPWEISYGNKNKHWFKCSKNVDHKSELKCVKDFTGGCEGVMYCKQCNSIAQWFINNNLNINDYWDFENNVVDPWEISYGSGKKCWFKCQEKDYHGSYELQCCQFTKGIRCPYCSNSSVHPKDSLGQYIIDNYGEEFLWSIWSDKNKKSPFEYAPNSKFKVWWKCQCGKHKDYLRRIGYSNRYEFVCQNCSKEMNNSIIEERTRMYLKKTLGYEVLTEYDCSINTVNPKTKRCLPYDNEIILSNGKHLIIEVHGEQHYKLINENSKLVTKGLTPEEYLHQRQLYDRYKRIKCKQAGYEYLEIPYTAFEGKNKEQYKQMIDDKIRNILNNDK